MAEYKLYYFPARGRAELIRLMFVAGGAKFEDIRIPMSEWASKKKCKYMHATVQVIVGRLTVEFDVLLFCHNM